MKYLSTFMLGLLLSPFLFASTGSGDINFIFEHNPSHQGYKFRLIINNNAISLIEPKAFFNLGLITSLYVNFSMFNGFATLFPLEMFKEYLFKYLVRDN